MCVYFTGCVGHMAVPQPYIYVYIYMIESWEIPKLAKVHCLEPSLNP